MKIAIVGTGAMGSIYAALLADTGHDVLAVGRPGAHMAAISEVGLRVSGASGDRTVRLRTATVPPAEIFDLIVVAVKATQVVAAAPAIAPMIGPETRVLAMQNGVGSADSLAEAFGPHRLLVGIAAAFGAGLVAPGHAHHKGMEAIKIGAFGDLGLADVEAIADIWRGAGFNASAAPNIVAMQWEKLICNASFSAPCAIARLTVGQALDDPDLGPVCLAAGREAWAIAKAAGIGITVSDPEAHIRAFAARVAGAKPSLLQDVEAGRPSEIDFINGAVPRAAKSIGRDAPVNSMLTALVRAIERRGRLQHGAD